MQTGKERRPRAGEPCASRRRCASVLLLATAALLPATRVRAGNDEGILIGSQAALTGGAVTATTADGSAAWYNPAGLGRITQQALEVHASAYGISLNTAKRFIALPDGSTADAHFTDWQLIPTALSYTRLLSDRVVGALGIMIPYTTDLDLRTNLRATDGTHWTLGIDDVRNEYAYIASVGVRVSPTLRWGVALHGVYISSEQTIQIGIGRPDARGTTPFQSSSRHETVSDYGVRAGVGLQWSPTPGLELGIAVQTPTLTAFRRTRNDEVDTRYRGPGEEADYASPHEDELTAPWRPTTPLAVRLGAALMVGRTQLLLDGSFTSPLAHDGDGLNREANANVRAATFVEASDTLGFGIGLFTDLNGYRAQAPNFVGVAGGVRLASHYRVVENERRLTFATTLAGRYAYGWGDTDGLDFRDTEGPRPMSQAKLMVHELAFNLGGTLAF